MGNLILLLLAGLGGYALYRSQIMQGLIGPRLDTEGKIQNLPQLPVKNEKSKLEVTQEGNLRIQFKPQVIKKNGEPVFTYVPNPVVLDLNKIASGIKEVFTKKPSTPQTVISSTERIPPEKPKISTLKDDILTTMGATGKCPIDGQTLIFGKTDNSRSAGTTIKCPKHGLLAYQPSWNKDYILNNVMLNYLKEIERLKQ